MDLQTTVRLCVAGALALLLTACATPPAPQGSLYERLGGDVRVSLVVSRTVDRAAIDPRTQRSFERVKLSTVKQSIRQQICQIGGGGCVDEGTTTSQSRSDLKIADDEFDAVVMMLREELDFARVDAGAKNELLRLLAPIRRQIVMA